MSRLVNLAAAARSLDIGRAELQELIKQGEIATFEGRVDLAKLEEIYPNLALQNQNKLLERTQLLKDTAFGRRIQEVTATPSSEDLSSQVRRLTAELDIERARSRKYRSIVQELAEELTLLHRHCSNSEQRSVYAELRTSLLQRITA